MKSKMNISKLIILSLLLSFFIGSHLIAGDLEFRGQLSATGLGFYSSDSWNKLLGLRYIPQITHTEILNDEMFIDTELHLNMFFSHDFTNPEYNIKLYRLKLRFATTQSELRIGLQKINFGPAYILRPLRWFDKLDPRDALGLTDGVYALRYKYNFLNNAQIWLWGLYRNSGTKGYDILPTSLKKPELGGRFQLPFLDGESAVTIHSRIVDASIFEYRETKVALDGRWDIEVGLWFESVLQKNDHEMLPYKWNSMTTLGTDYTFEIGNGLHVIGEHMFFAASEKPFGTEVHYHMTAIMANYPLGLFDGLMGMVFFSWEDHELYKFVQWQRTYDNFILSLSMFHYPEGNLPSFGNSGSVPNQGYGFQFTIIYNH
ncbi:MAG: hypothetical protein KKA84_10215 [Bacteroidetes bacterium]|nr:hypothetical protein [Bacteroidota bacterium]